MDWGGSGSVEGDGCGGGVERGDDGRKDGESGVVLVELVGDLDEIERREQRGEPSDGQKQAPKGAAPHKPGEQQRYNNGGRDQERGLDIDAEHPLLTRFVLPVPFGLLPSALRGFTPGGLAWCDLLVVLVGLGGLGGLGNRFVVGVLVALGGHADDEEPDRRHH